MREGRIRPAPSSPPLLPTAPAPSSPPPLRPPCCSYFYFLSPDITNFFTALANQMFWQQTFTVMGTGCGPYGRYADSSYVDPKCEEGWGGGERVARSERRGGTAFGPYRRYADSSYIDPKCEEGGGERGWRGVRGGGAPPLAPTGDMRTLATSTPSARRGAEREGEGGSVLGSLPPSFLTVHPFSTPTSPHHYSPTLTPPSAGTTRAAP